MNIDKRKLNTIYIWLMGSEIDFDKKGDKKEFPIRIPVKTEEQIKYIKHCMDLNSDILNVWVFSDDYKFIVKVRTWEEWEESKAYRWDLNTWGRILERWGDPEHPDCIRPYKGAGINSANDTMNYYKNRRAKANVDKAIQKKESAKGKEKSSKETAPLNHPILAIPLF